MKLAKDSIDIGVQTNQKDAMFDFWQKTVGLPYEELLKVGGGNHQHRHSLNGSVFKLNHLREPIADSLKTGYQGLLIAREGIVEPTSFIDPEGIRVTLVPPAHLGVTHIGIEMNVRSISAFQHFYRHTIEAQEINETTFKWGSTLFFLSEDCEHQPCVEMRGKGFRYITVQVWKVDAEHAEALTRGAGEARPPTTLGSTARISFITDPDGNWIEISQRASLTGNLST